MNWLTDMDWGWWPLVKYRPNKNEYIDNKVTLKITPFFGSVSAIIILILINEFNNITLTLSAFVIGWVVFFIIYRLTFAVAWNIRADHINQQNEYE